MKTQECEFYSEARASRIDFALDFYEREMNEFQVLPNRILTSRTYSRKGELETMYLGKPKSLRQTRIYNKAAEITAKGYEPVLESNAVFTNGESIIETTYGDIVRNDDGFLVQEYDHAEISEWEKRQRFVERTRINLLFQSDWTQVVDSPLSDADKAAWATYRQALRDLPGTLDYSTISQSEDVNWPFPPGVEVPVVAKEDEDGHVPVDQPL